MPEVWSDWRFASRTLRAKFCSSIDTLDRDRRRLLPGRRVLDRFRAGSWSMNNPK